MSETTSVLNRSVLPSRQVFSLSFFGGSRGGLLTASYFYHCRFESLEGQAFDPKQHVVLTVLNVICAAVFGKRYQFDDPEFLKIIQYSDNLVWLLPAANLFDIFPWLQLLPLKFNRVLKETNDARDGVINLR